MTPENLHQMAQMIAMALQQAGVGQPAHAVPVPGGGGGGRSRPCLDTKAMRIRDFDGAQNNWEQWIHSFKSAIRSCSPTVLTIMEEAEKMASEATDENIGEDALEPRDEIGKMSGELYNILGQYCTGEALTIVRGVQSFEGFLVWQKIFKKFSPKTMARSIRLISEVTGPKMIKELKDVDGAITNWESKVKRLETECGETLSDTMQIAILTGMMPAIIQDYVYTNVDENTKYKPIADRVRAWVGNKVAMLSGPTPMEIGQVEDNWGWDEQYLNMEDWENAEVQAVGANTQCYRCHGWGHLGRECPTNSGKSKGKGKEGMKGKGKGPYKGTGKGGKGFFDGKGGGKGFGEKGKGKGQGYQGTCWSCGVVGHKSSECRNSGMTYNVNDESPGDIGHVDVDVGGVWMIGAVHVERDDAHSKPPGLGGCRSIKTANSFEALAGEESDEDEWDDVEKQRGWRFQRKHNIAAVDIGAVEKAECFKGGMSRESGMKFNVAAVKKPLASAAKVVGAGNRISMGPNPNENFIENASTGEKIGLRVEGGTYVFDVKYQNGELGTITLDSGAGVNVWPKELQEQVPMQPKDPKLRMTAANGSSIENLGTKVIHFVGMEPGFSWRV
jgi:hypothetical protein